jgi:hypothetical protein
MYSGEQTAAGNCVYNATAYGPSGVDNGAWPLVSDTGQQHTCHFLSTQIVRMRILGLTLY